MQEELQKKIDEAMRLNAKRPKFLRVICMISLFFGLYRILQSIQMLFMRPSTAGEISDSVKDLKVSELGPMEEYFSIEEYTDFAYALSDNWDSFYISSILLTIMAMIGAFQMFKLKRRGFFMYGTAYLLYCFYPVILIENNNFTWLMTIANLFGTALMITLYAIHLKYMDEGEEGVE